MAGPRITLILLAILSDPMTGMRRGGTRGINSIHNTGRLLITGILTGALHKKSVSLALVGAGIAVFLRFLVHYFVGAFVWYYIYAFPPGYGQWVWPAVYNGSFLIVEFIISSVVLSILIKRGTLDYRL